MSKKNVYKFVVAGVNSNDTSDLLFFKLSGDVPFLANEFDELIEAAVQKVADEHGYDTDNLVIFDCVDNSAGVAMGKHFDWSSIPDSEAYPY